MPLNEFEFSWSKISDIQPQLEKLVMKNYFLNLSAKEAFKAYVRSYESHSLKQVKFDAPSITTTHILENFAIYIDFHLKSSVNHETTHRYISY